MRRGIAIVMVLGGALAAALLVGDKGAPGEPVASAAPPTAAVPRAALSDETTTTVTGTPAETSPRRPVGNRPSPAPDRRAELSGLARDAYLGWFDAIYRFDAHALASWVGSPALYEAGLAAMAGETIAFSAAPSAAAVRVTVDDVLRDTAKCVVLRTSVDVTRLIETAAEPSSVITVFHPNGDRLRMAARWGSATPSAVWAVDCDPPPAGDRR